MTSAAKQREGNGAARGLATIARARGLTVRRLVCADDPRDLASLQGLQGFQYDAALQGEGRGRQGEGRGAALVLNLAAEEVAPSGTGAESGELPGGGAFGGDVSDTRTACGRLLRTELEALFSSNKNRQ